MVEEGMRGQNSFTSAKKGEIPFAFVSSLTSEKQEAYLCILRNGSIAILQQRITTKVPLIDSGFWPAVDH